MEIVRVWGGCVRVWVAVRMAPRLRVVICVVVRRRVEVEARWVTVE